MCKDGYHGSVDDFVSKWQSSCLTGFIMKGPEWENTQLFCIESQSTVQGAQAAHKIRMQVIFKAGNIV